MRSRDVDAEFSCEMRLAFFVRVKTCCEGCDEGGPPELWFDCLVLMELLEGLCDTFA